MVSKVSTHLIKQVVGSAGRADQLGQQRLAGVLNDNRRFFDSFPHVENGIFVPAGGVSGYFVNLIRWLVMNEVKYFDNIRVIRHMDGFILNSVGLTSR